MRIDLIQLLARSGLPDFSAAKTGFVIDFGEPCAILPVRDVFFMHRARARLSEHSVAKLVACDSSLAASWGRYLQPLLQVNKEAHMGDDTATEIQDHAPGVFDNPRGAIHDLL